MLPINCTPADAAAFTLMRQAYDLERQAAALRAAAAELVNVLARTPPPAATRGPLDVDPFGPSAGEESRHLDAVATSDRPTAPANRKANVAGLAPRTGRTGHTDPRARLA